ncbi:hypothetical protein SO802_012429 [Lithocarpus litseifolius]|uniref:Uncharacterized protein n=1 Tax=Lithocarpus litseifolius TaxID=425828 RepID=A0AAW2D594_9ROSI
MTVTPYDFYYITSHSFKGAIISLDGFWRCIKATKARHILPISTPLWILSTEAPCDNLWGLESSTRNDGSYAKRLLEGLDYEEFNITRLMPSLTVQGGLATGKPIDPPHLPWTVYAYSLDGFAQERAMPCNPNPTIQEYEELVWLAVNLNYSREMYGLEGVAHPGDGEDDDDGEEEDSEATSSYQPRK